MTRILSVFKFLKRVGFALLVLGGKTFAHAQPYEPTFLLDVTGEVGQHLGFSGPQALGDQNGDGFDDIVTYLSSADDTPGLRIYYGNNTGQAVYTEFGRLDPNEQLYGWADAAFDAGFTVPAGDFNGDGHQDILRDLCLWDGSNCEFHQVLFLGGPGVFDTLADYIGDPTNLQFTTNVGDYNGDGRDDFTKRPLGGQWFGLYLGSEPPLSETAEWEHLPNRAHMGFGDVNGDGYADFGMSYFIGSQDIARTEIFLGSPAADSVADVVIERTTGDIEWNGRIVGDVNGDGYDDVMTQYGSWSIGRRWFLYFGGQDMDTVVDREYVWGNGLDSPRYATPLGDINDDGYDDYALYNHYLTPPNDLIEVWLGGNPLPTSPAWVLDGEFDGMNYPYRIGQAGDFNGDGIDDWFFSAYHGLEERGRILVVAGDRNFGLAVNEPLPLVPQEISISVFPNPFNSTLSISLEAPLYSYVTVLLYDLLGREVDVVYRGRLVGNTISYAAPAGMASGVYFLRAESRGVSVMRKVVLLK